MWLHTFIVVTILLSSQILSSVGKDFNLHLCSNNETIAVQILTTASTTKLSCQCQAGPSIDPDMKDDYVHTTGVGSHKLHINAKTWNEARRICYDEGGHLAIINSKLEEKVLTNMLTRSQERIAGAATPGVALVGIHDLYTEGDWVTVLGEPLHATGYSDWTNVFGHQEPDNYGSGQNCGALEKRGGFDDVFCHYKHAFFCEQPLAC